MSEDSTPSTPVKLRFWENWNARTRSTVQYVGLDESESARNRSLPGDEDEDEDDGDDSTSVGDSRGPSHMHLSLRTPHTAERLSYRDDERESLNSLHLLDKEKRLSERSSHRDSKKEDVAVNQFCVFPSYRNMQIRDLVYYDNYYNYPDMLKQSALETSEEYRCTRKEGTHH